MFGFHLISLSLTVTALAVTYEDDPAILANEREVQALLSQLDGLLGAAPSAKVETFNRAAIGVTGLTSKQGTRFDNVPVARNNIDIFISQVMIIN